MSEAIELRSNAYIRLRKTLARRPNYLPIITEGDSWFAFPGLLFRRNIVAHLLTTFEGNLAPLIMSHNGDQMKDIMQGNQRRRLRYALANPRYNFRMLLFSAGGNDLIDNLTDFVKQKKVGMKWWEAVNDENLDMAIKNICDHHAELVAMRDELRPSCHIFTHCYDYPIVNGKAIRILGKPVSGPWIKPVLDSKGITSNQEQKAIVKLVIRRFYQLLKVVEKRSKRFTVVDTCGTLSARHWQDEIHPSDLGFKLVAERFRDAIKNQFPGAF